MTYLGKKEITQQAILTKLWKAKAFIDENPQHEYTILAIAREATLSESHFSRCFKKTYGYSPYQYYLLQKMNRSAELLRNPELDMTTVALEVGFSELSAFSRRFKKMFGMPPLQYKKQQLSMKGSIAA